MALVLTFWQEYLQLSQPSQGAMQDTKLWVVYQEVVFYPNGTGSLSF
jgi:hypothetical protein